jgi:hypothetical protein
MILHTTEVTPLPGYRLFLRFNNGEAGEVDLSTEIDGEVFEALHDPAVFAYGKPAPGDAHGGMGQRRGPCARIPA